MTITMFDHYMKIRLTLSKSSESKQPSKKLNLYGLYMQIQKELSKSDEVVAVMSDWDNTIMASADFLYEVLSKTAEVLKKQKIELRTEVPRIATKKQEDIIKELFGEEHFNKAWPEFRKVYEATFKPKDLKMLPGARRFLEKLNAAEIPFAIISNYTVSGIEQHLNLRDIDHNRTVIIGVDTASHTKPHIAPGLLALEKLNLSIQTQTITLQMIGDGISSDMMFANNMNEHLQSFNNKSSCQGFLFNSLLSGHPIFSPSQLESMPANLKQVTIVHSYSALLEAIDELITKKNSKSLTLKMLEKQTESSGYILRYTR